jgi:GST-like protein
MKDNEIAYTLFTAKGTGSLLAELSFAAAEIPFRNHELAWTDEGLVDAELARVNPLKQLPTLVTPDGYALSQSAAIVLHLNDVAPNANLIPPAQSPKRLKFYHWFQYINAAIYPTFTFGDFPERWVPEEASEKLVNSTNDYRKQLWLEVEKVCEAPYFLGSEFSAVDLYIAVMLAWRPREDWFKEHTPKLFAVCEKIRNTSPFREVFERNKA